MTRARDGASDSDGGWSDAPARADDGVSSPSHPFSIEHRYRRGATLGMGGMGHVRVAWDRRLRRDVALKEMRREVSGAVAERLTREAWITATLEHPGIVPVHDAGRTEDGRLFYTMRLVRGRSLQDALAQAPDTEARLAFMRPFLALCETVAYAHSRGVVHRDLKPANVMMGAFGEVQVVDWGLARALDEDEALVHAAPGGAGLTLMGAIVGTPGWMSPEQARGEPADRRSDVWGLGAVLCALLTGEAPFVGEDAVTTVARGERIELASRTQGVPPALVAICARALSPDPDDRYPDAAALAADVMAWLDGRRVDAYRAPPWELLLALVRAWRAPLTVAAVAVALLALLGSVGVQRVRQERDRAEAAFHDAQVALADVLTTQAQEAARSGQRPKAEALAARALRLADSPEARGVFLRFTGTPRPERGIPVPLPYCDREVFGRDALLCLTAHETSLWPLGADAPRWTVPLVATDGALVHDQGRAVLVVGRRLHELHLDTGELARVHDQELTNDRPLVAAAPSRTVVFGGPVLVALDTVTGRLRSRLGCGGTDPVVDVAYDEARDLVAVVCGADRIERGPFDGPLQTTPWTQGVSVNAPTAIALVEDRVWLGTGDGRVLRLHEDGPSHVARTPGVISDLLAQDGLIAVQTEDAGLHVLDPRSPGWVVDLPSEGRVVRLEAGRAWQAGHTLVRWRLPVADRVGRYWSPVGLTSVAPSPDGAWLALTGAGGLAEVHRDADGTLVTARPAHPWVIKQAAWSPEGDRLWLAEVMPGGLWSWDGTDWRRVEEPSGYRRVAVLRGGVVVAATYGPGPHVWRPGEEAVDRRIARFDVMDLAAEGDEVLMLTAEGGLWRARLPDLEPEHVLDAPGALAVTRQGDRVVLVHEDGLRRLDGEDTDWLPDPHGELVDAALSPDGRWTVGAHLDGSLDVWRDDGTLAARVMAHDRRVAQVTFDAAGRLWSAGWDGVAAAYDLDILDLEPARLAEDAERAWRP